MYPDDKSRSAALLHRAKHVMPTGNTRHTVFFPPYPIYAQYGEGAWLTDVDGERRLDFINNYSSLIHGHRFGPTASAIEEQLQVLGSVGAPTELEIILAETLIGRLRFAEHIRFCNSGTEAVMYAIKAARAVTGRPKIAKIEGGYHGGYDYAEMSMNSGPTNWGSPDRPASVAVCRGTPEAIERDVVVLPMNDIETAQRVLDANAGQLAAILVDYMPSRLSFVEMRREFAAFLRGWTQKNNTVFLLDDVYSFRLSRGGSADLLGIEPDLITLGKIIGGGLPIGAVAGPEKFMEPFAINLKAMKMVHGGTFNANPLTMAAGRAAMDHLTPEAFARLDYLGDRLRTGLKQAIGDRGVRGAVKGRGSLASLTLMADEFEDYRSMERFSGRKDANLHLQHALLNRGLMVNSSGLFILSTPMTEDDIDFAVSAVTDALSEFLDENNVV